MREDWYKACDRLNGICDFKQFWTKFSQLTSKFKKKLYPDIVLNGQTSTTDQERADTFVDHMDKTCQTPTGNHFSEDHKTKVEYLILNNHNLFNPITPDPIQTSQTCGPWNHNISQNNVNQEDNPDDPMPKDQIEDEISNEEIKQRIKEMPNELTGDAISIQHVKYGSDKFFQILHIIFNNCIKFGYHPELWKSSIIIIILKPDKPSSRPGSYWPISLLPILGKLLEKIMTYCLTNYMVRHDHFNHFQYGFHSHKSTVHQLLCLAEQISFWFEQCSMGRTISIFIDMEKAFDMVWHDGL
jgi:hypothetical protein